MFGIIFAVIAAFALLRLCSTKLHFFIFGLIAAFFSSITNALLIILLLNEPPAIVVFNALSSIFYHTILIWLIAYTDIRRKRKKDNVAKIIEHEKIWDLNEVATINSVLNKFESVKSDTNLNDALKTNLMRLSTEELLSKLDSNHFEEDSLPTVLHVLSLRSVTSNS